MIVPVLAPAPVDHVPPRSRKPRRSWVAAPAHAAIPEADEAGFEVLELGGANQGRWVSGPRLHLRGGLAYRKLDLGYGRGPLRPEQFLDWLRGALPFVGHGSVTPRNAASSALEHEFLETPLVARVPFKAARGAMGLGNQLVEEAVEETLGRLRRDDRPRAARDAARFLAEGILVTGSAVYRRYHPMVQLDSGTTLHAKDRPYTAISLDSMPEHGLSMPVRADALDAALRLRGARADLVDPALARMLEALPATAHGDDDLVPVVAEASRAMGRHLRHGRSVLEGRGLPFGEEAEGILAGVRELERLACTGAHFPETLPTAIATLRAAATLHLRHGHGRSLAPVRVDTLAALDAYLGHVVGTRLSRAPIPDEDLDALVAAGP